MMKQFILYTIFCNVFLLPWGMSQLGTAFGQFGSVIALLFKFLLVALAVIVVETVQSRLRFYRYQGTLGCGISVCRACNCLESVALRRAFDVPGTRQFALQASIFSSLAVVSLLLTFVMLGSHWLRNYVYAFAVQSWLIAAPFRLRGLLRRLSELYMIAVLTALFRGLVLPYLLMRIIARLNVKRELHAVLQPSSSLVLGAFLVMFAFVIANHMNRHIPVVGACGCAGAHHHACNEVFSASSCWLCAMRP